MKIFECEQFVDAPLEIVFAFFAEAKNLEEITPPLLNFQILSMSTPQIQKGSIIWYKLKLRGVPMKWQTLISEWNPPYHFVDEQLSGPYRIWRHTHTFKQVEGRTLISDRVEYELPFGALGDFLAGRWVANDVNSIFSYRRSIIERKFPTSVVHKSF